MDDCQCFPGWFYEITDDPVYLGKARAWAKKSVDLESTYSNNETLAAIYFKLKEKDLTAKHAQIAIELAKKDGDKAKETKELLEKINAMWCSSDDRLRLMIRWSFHLWWGDRFACDGVIGSALGSCSEAIPQGEADHKRNDHMAKPITFF